jgi:hypothetical protein
MTAIAAIALRGRVWIGGDSAAVEQSHYLDLAATPKVFTLGEGRMVLGYTSSFRMGHALQHRLTLPPALPGAGDVELLDRWMAVEFMDAVRQVMRDVGYMKREYDREQGGQFLVGVRGHIYQCDDDFHARRQHLPYAACGAGISACLGAMWMVMQDQDRLLGQPPESILRDVLAAAEACVVTVRGPFHVADGGAAV